MIKMLVCDFDGTISGGPTDELTEFTSYVEAQTGMQFVVATGRTFHSINDGLAQHTLPRPHTIVSDVGTQIHHKRTLTPDNDWHTKMDCLWMKDEFLPRYMIVAFWGNRHLNIKAATS